MMQGSTQQGHGQGPDHGQGQQAAFDAFLSDHNDGSDAAGAPVDLSGGSFAPIAPQPQFAGSADQHIAGTGAANPGAYGTNAARVPPPLWMRLLSCLTVDNYREYFDVDTIDVQNRVVGSLRHFNEHNAFWDRVLTGKVEWGYPGGSSSAAAVAAEEDGGEDGDGRHSSDPKIGSMSIAPTPGAGGGDRVKGPDMYGPFWVATSLIFVLAVTSNLSKYMNRPKGGEYKEDFEYDVALIGHAIWIVYGFTFGVPLALSLAFWCIFGRSATSSSSSDFVGNLPSFSDMTCLYGYSMIAYVFAAFLSGVVPFSPVQWLLLLAATAFSLVLVLRNMVGFVMGQPLPHQQESEEEERQFVHSQRARGGPILGSIIGCHVIFLLVIKLTFYSHHVTK